MNITFKKISGFSLIELSLALVVVASLSVVAITKYTSGKQAEKQAQAYKDLRKIKTAIEDYVAANHRYPCPAAPAYNEADNLTSFGVGLRQRETGNCMFDGDDVTTNGTGILSGEILANSQGESEDSTRFQTNGINAYYDAKAVFSHHDVIMGTVPCKDIGLPSDCMFDPQGNKYSYAVVPELARIDACSIYVFSLDDRSSDQTLSRLKVLKGLDLDRYSTALENYLNGYNYTGEAPPDPLDDPDYVLIYYGPDGFGAYPNNGGMSRIQPVLMSGADPALSSSYIGDNTYQEINHNLHWAQQGNDVSFQMDEFFFMPDKPLGSGYTFGDILVFGRSTYLNSRYCVSCNSICGMSPVGSDVIAVTDFGTTNTCDGAGGDNNGVISAKCAGNDPDTEGDVAGGCTTDADCDPGGCAADVPGSCCGASGACVNAGTVAKYGACSQGEGNSSGECVPVMTCKAANLVDICDGSTGCQCY